MGNALLNAGVTWIFLLRSQLSHQLFQTQQQLLEKITRNAFQSTTNGNFPEMYYSIRDGNGNYVDYGFTPNYGYKVWKVSSDLTPGKYSGHLETAENGKRTTFGWVYFDFTVVEMS
eukprot:TRINITY_DN2784_c0_g1_i3.p1 TRINITY_DN2784_c0_g1~~TRINITY_DN2784_c0_g1_i3.p1  ORF type:complete len:116 (+),score=18.53 TRINITY_DN2784_c0_g1_i3:422-769(+)